MKRVIVLCLLLVGGLVTGPSTDGQELRLNQIQVIGTHNSYHVEPVSGMLQLIGMTDKTLPLTLQYTHRPLPEQLSRLGIRQIELDVFADPDGGLFANPRGRGILLAQQADAGEDPNPDGQLNQPGFKILHVQDIDYRTTVPTLTSALQQLHDWSTAHPQHVPLFVLLELKESAESPLLTPPVRFTPALLDQLDEVIRSVITPARLITPDDVRGRHETLRDAIQADGWPQLDQSRGRIMFAMDNPGRLRDVYLQDHPTLQKRVLFTSARSPEDADAAFFKYNDPVRQFDRIQQTVHAGFLVRTRADSETQQARANDTSTRDRAFASGAQWISTDYPEPDKRWSEYQVRFPDGRAVRANPLTAPAGAQIPDVDPAPENAP